MQFGLCGGENEIEVAQKCGFDYIELPAAACLNPDTQDDYAFERLRQMLTSREFTAEAFNLLLPADLPCAGPEVDEARLRRYFSQVMRRGAELGGKTVVFGSGRQRSAPSGYDAAAAHEQLLNAFALSADSAREFGMIVAIEPLSQAESNQVNSVADATAIVKAVNHPALRVLSDLYHVTQEGQSFSETAESGELLVHVHVAGENRRAPLAGDTELLARYFRAVKAAGSVPRISIEARWDESRSFAEQASIAFDTLWAAWSSA